ncbi:hypothetical protein TNCV_1737381 [Trichonephila clavipes]|nr:hypothetical protein TNCV_1737381 [Trichonephila clavipes]
MFLACPVSARTVRQRLLQRGLSARFRGDRSIHASIRYCHKVPGLGNHWVTTHTSLARTNGNLTPYIPVIIPDCRGLLNTLYRQDNARPHVERRVQTFLLVYAGYLIVTLACTVYKICHPLKTSGLGLLCVPATAGSDVVQSGRPIFDDFFQHLWPYIGNNNANVVFQMVKRLWLIRIDQ